MSKIVIVQTSDIHGFFYNNNYFEEKKIGLFSIASQLSKADIKIDSGDLIQGSALTTYQSKNNLSKNNAIIQSLNDIGYDLLTIGNHEFNYGKEYLVNSLKSFNGEIIIANISGILGLDVKPYKVFEIKGLKVAIIGFVTSVVPFFEEKSNIEGIEFYNPVDIYKRFEKTLQEEADVIVVNYHGGFEYDITNPNPTIIETTKENQGVELLENFDSIDILLTGHQHQVICEKFKNTLVMQPGYAGEYFSKIEIDIDSKEIKGELIANTGKVNETLSRKNEKLEHEVQSFLNTYIYNLDDDIVIENHFKARLEGCDYINLIHLIQLDACDAEISVTSLFDTAIGFKKNITMRQIIANYPFSNSLKCLKLHRDDIIAAMEVSASYFEINDNEIGVSERFTVPKKQNYQYDFFYGFNFEIDINNPIGNKVVYTDLEDRYYNVVMSNYRASNFGWYPMYEKGEVIKEVATDMQELIMNYLFSNKLDKKQLKKKNFKIIY